MTSFFLVISLVVAAIAANLVYAVYPKIPLAFYQIGAGVLLSFLPTFDHFQLEPEMFMLVIIAPLMFNDGQNTDSHRLKHNFNSTLSLAVVLAIVTILVGGFLTHAFWYVLPLPLCFALAAIVTPTDAVAVSSITNDIDVPEHVMGALENESLFNDASGIVALDLALSAYATGEFSITKGAEHFLIAFFGGILAGLVMGAIIVLIRVWFQRKALDTVGVVLPFNLLTPFVVYLAAEHMGVSGILAVVAAGIIHGLQQKRLRLTSTQTQVVTKTTWEVVTNLLNGFVFVLLGAAAPSVVNSLSKSESAHIGILIIVAVGLYLLMTLLRFLWSMLNLVDLHSKETELKDSLILALSGVHGTITLAMAFSLPATIAGKPFPVRNAIILVAGIIILLSLIMPTLILPFLLPKSKAAFTQSEFDNQLNRMVNFSVEQLKQTNQGTSALPSVIEVLSSQKNDSFKSADSKLAHQLLEQAEQAEQTAIIDLIESGDAEQQIAWQYNRAALFQIQFAFLSPIARIKMWAKLSGMRVFPKIAQKHYHKKIAHTRQQKEKWLKEHADDPRIAEYRRKHPNVNHHDRREKLLQQDPEYAHQSRQNQRGNRGLSIRQRRELRQQADNGALRIKIQSEFQRLEEIGFTHVSDYLDSIETDDNQREVAVVKHYYTVRHQRFTQNDDQTEEENELFVLAFQFEYSFVQNASKQENWSSELATELQKKISMDQLVYMQSTN